MTKLKWINEGTFAGVTEWSAETPAGECAIDSLQKSDTSGIWDWRPCLGWTATIWTKDGERVHWSASGDLTYYQARKLAQSYWREIND